MQEVVAHYVQLTNQLSSKTNFPKVDQHTGASGWCAAWNTRMIISCQVLSLLLSNFQCRAISRDLENILNNYIKEVDTYSIINTENTHILLCGQRCVWWCSSTTWAINCRRLVHMNKGGKYGVSPHWPGRAGARCTSQNFSQYDAKPNECCRWYQGVYSNV